MAEETAKRAASPNGGGGEKISATRNLGENGRELVNNAIGHRLGTISTTVILCPHCYF